MHLLISCIGKRGYIADFFRPHLAPGDQIVGTSNTWWTPGFIACDRSVLLPDITSSEYIEALLNACDAHGITAVFSLFDPDVVRIAKHRQEFIDRSIVPVVPMPEVADIAFDKWAAYQFFRSQKLPTAATFDDLPSAYAALDAGVIRFPLVVKPRRGFGSRHTFRARSRTELDVFFGYAPEMLIQEWLPGDEYNLDILNDLTGRVLAIVPWRKYRSVLGETEQAITVKDDRLLEFGLRLATLVGNIGPMDVDLFVTPDEIRVLELNTRFGGGYPVSHLAGADFPRLLVRMLRGETVAPCIGQFEEQVVMMKTLGVHGGRLVEFARDHRFPAKGA